MNGGDMGGVDARAPLGWRIFVVLSRQEEATSVHPRSLMLLPHFSSLLWRHTSLPGVCGIKNTVSASDQA